jgi:hypothetical protein
MFGCQNERWSGKVQSKRSELKTELEKVIDGRINSEGKGTRTIQYPVMSR